MDKEKKIRKEHGDAFIHISITNSLNKIEKITICCRNLVYNGCLGIYTISNQGQTSFDM